MAFEIEGNIKLIMDTLTLGSGFTKREFVVTIGDDRYPQDIKMEVVKDKTMLLDKYKAGQRVKIGFDLRGNEHNGRYYVTVQAWRIHLADGSDAPAAGDAPPRNSAPPSQPRPERAAPRPPDRGGDDRGSRGPDRGGKRDWEEDRRGGGRREEFRGGGGKRSNQEDDIDF